MRSRFLYGEYVVVISSQSGVEKYLQEALKIPRFKKENFASRLIWLCGEENEKAHDESEWRKELDSHKSLPKDWFVENIEEPLSPPTPARVYMEDITNHKSFIPLKNIASQVSSIVLFSDNPEEDQQLTMLIGVLKKYVPNASIAAECFEPRFVPYLWEAGADEVFNRQTMRNHVAISVLLEDQLPNFVASLLEKKGSTLGLSSSSIRALRLTLKDDQSFVLGQDQWNFLEDLSGDLNVTIIAVYYREGNKFSLRSFQALKGYTLHHGDSLLVLADSISDFNEFETKLTGFIRS